MRSDIKVSAKPYENIGASGRGQSMGSFNKTFVNPGRKIRSRGKTSRSSFNKLQRHPPESFNATSPKKRLVSGDANNDLTSEVQNIEIQISRNKNLHSQLQ